MNAIPIRSLVYTALCSALFIVFSALQLKLAFSPVPITFQTMAVIFIGMLLKPRAAFLSVAIVIVLGLLGLPVFGGKSGIAHILGPTGGFILYFPFGAMLISFCVDKLEARFARSSIQKHIAYLLVFLLFSSWLAYVVGVPWFMAVLDNMTVLKALGLACYPYLPGDAVKAIVAAAVFIALHKPVMQLRSQQQTRKSNSSKGSASALHTN